MHGRLPYEQIKSDSQLRNMLLSITQRKIVSTIQNAAGEKVKHINVNKINGKILNKINKSRDVSKPIIFENNHFFQSLNFINVNKINGKFLNKIIKFCFQIFTNSDRNHAVKVLDRLGLNDCFDQIICFETMNQNLSKSCRPDEFPVVLKPSMDAMKIALAVAKVDPRRTVCRKREVYYYYKSKRF